MVSGNKRQVMQGLSSDQYLHTSYMHRYRPMHKKKILGLNPEFVFEGNHELAYNMTVAA